MTDRRQTIDRRANWVVCLRVHDKADLCVYGPGTLREANAFRAESVGCGMERYVAQLIPFPRKQEPDLHSAALQNNSTKEK